MYCKNCGKEIEEDSKFCKYCGQNLLSAQVESDQNESALSEEKGHFWRGFLIIIVVSILLIILTLGIAKCATDGGNKKVTSTSRSAVNADIGIKTEESLFSYDIILTPNRDISNLQIKFEFYGDDDRLIATKTKVVGDVKKGTQYDISFAISEFSLSSLTKISKFRWNVIGGTVQL